MSNFTSIIGRLSKCLLQADIQVKRFVLFHWINGNSQKVGFNKVKNNVSPVNDDFATGKKERFCLNLLKSTYLMVM